MDQSSNIIIFPKRKRAKPVSKKRIQNMDRVKYFNIHQIQLLRRTVKEQAELAKLKKTSTAIKEWACIDLLTCSGVRVSEAANLRCSDLKFGYSQCEIFVRQGKGSRSRTIQVPATLKTHLNSFLRWKQSVGEDLADEAHVFIGQRGPWTSQAIQNVVKKYLKNLGLYEHGKSAHALRHSYGVELYRREKDIRVVQQQLGHSSVRTTQIYTSVLNEDIQNQIKGLWGRTS